MKLLHYLLGILSAFCLIFILLITSVEAVVYWTPGYFEKEYEKYQVLDHLPAMTMEDLLEVTDEMMDYLRGDREDLQHHHHPGRTGAGIFQRTGNRPYGGCA